MDDEREKRRINVSKFEAENLLKDLCDVEKDSIFKYLYSKKIATEIRNLCNDGLVADLAGKDCMVDIENLCTDTANEYVYTTKINYATSYYPIADKKQLISLIEQNIDDYKIKNDVYIVKNYTLEISLQTLTKHAFGNREIPLNIFLNSEIAKDPSDFIEKLNDCARKKNNSTEDEPIKNLEHLSLAFYTSKIGSFVNIVHNNENSIQVYNSDGKIFAKFDVVFDNTAYQKYVKKYKDYLESEEANEEKKVYDCEIDSDFLYNNDFDEGQERT